MNVQLFIYLNLFIWVAPFLAAKGTKAKLLVAATFVVSSSLGYAHPAFAFLSAIGGLVLLFVQLSRDKEIPIIVKEENLYSLEFWMFLGALIFFLSAAVIIAKTSVPVFNKVFTTSIAPPEDIEFSHNNI